MKIKLAILAIALATIAPSALFAQAQPDICSKIQSADTRIDDRSARSEERALRVIRVLKTKLNRLVARNEAKKDQIHGRADGSSCSPKVAYESTLFSAGRCNIE